VDAELARHPAKVWKVSEFLALAAAQPPVFAPGTGFFYSNTDYNLLGLIIERITLVRPCPRRGTGRSRARTRMATGSLTARRSI
jgi:Beta-lactamase